MSDESKNLLLLLDRIQEPVFKPKGPNDSVFDIDNNYLPNRFKEVGPVILSRWGEEAKERISVKQIDIPEFGDILNFGRQENFSVWIPKHQRLASQLIQIFMDQPTVADLQSSAVYIRDRCNPYLFVYAFSVALIHRPDTQHLDIPNYMEMFPDKYLDGASVGRAREETAVVDENAAIRRPIEIPKDYTASDLEMEHRIAYWREDIGLNLHHWHWHLVYINDGPRDLVAKNRRGEIFSYSHQQIVRRYDFERLCNKLARVAKFNNFREEIPEAYFPKLDSVVASRAWPPRFANMKWSDINREVDQIRQDVSDMERWRDRIYEAIHKGSVENEAGTAIPLTESEGIDILGNVVDSTILSPNRTFYGNLHAMGHVFFAFIHDPDNRHLEPIGVMGDFATTMRDPVFYRWHRFVDDIFQEFRATLPRYNVARLNYPGVTVSKVEVSSPRSPVNVLNTFWQQSDVNISRGLDFQPRGPVLARFTHLQNQPFNYTITVNNEGAARKGTCRIFIAPRFDERGNPWLFRDQKEMFIELDKFAVDLTSGANTITRRSDQSSVTIPFDRTFRDVDTNRPTGGQALEDFNFCGCGWPQHLLIPKGTPEGFPCHLFVMISDFAQDNVQQDLLGACDDASAYCGVRSKLYPDRRSMGYPFDRMPRTGVDTLQQFLTPNMRVQEVAIRFRDTVVRRKTTT